MRVVCESQFPDQRGAKLEIKFAVVVKVRKFPTTKVQRGELVAARVGLLLDTLGQEQTRQ